MEDDIFSKPVEKNVPERHEGPKRSSKKGMITYPKEAVSPTLKWLIVLACALAVGLFIVAYFQAVNDWMDQEDNLATQTTHKVTPTPTATLTPTPTTTSAIPADWKTFTNATYKISLKYPSNYTVSEQAGVKTELPAYTLHRIIFLDETKSVRKTITMEIVGASAELAPTGTTIVTQENATIGGQAGKKINGNIYAVKSGNYIYRIAGGQEADTITQNYLDLMVKSIQFNLI